LQLCFLRYPERPDFFTTEVRTWRGLVTDYTVFVIDRESRRVQIVGSARQPNDPCMRQVVRTSPPWTAAFSPVTTF
jgi:hypothetical protein